MLNACFGAMWCSISKKTKLEITLKFLGQYYDFLQIPKRFIPNFIRIAKVLYVDI